MHPVFRHRARCRHASSLVLPQAGNSRIYVHSSCCNLQNTAKRTDLCQNDALARFYAAAAAVAAAATLATLVAGNIKQPRTVGVEDSIAADGSCRLPACQPSNRVW
jgi:hypothetical protein